MNPMLGPRPANTWEVRRGATKILSAQLLFPYLVLLQVGQQMSKIIVPQTSTCLSLLL